VTEVPEPAAATRAVTHSASRPDGVPARALWSWCLFDWANSAFPTVIITFVFSAYFELGVSGKGADGTAHWAFAQALSGILIAILSPILGAIADFSGRRKLWLAALSGTCVVATAMLWFVEPDPSWALWALVLVSIANIGFEMGTVFYNAMLPGLVRQSHLGRLSGWAWGLGYAGGLVCLALTLVLFVQAEQPLFGLDKAQSEHVRIVGPFVAVWFLLFAVPLFLFVPDAPQGLRMREAVGKGLRQLRGTVKTLRAHREIARFLIARLFYIDGLNTLFAMGGLYAAGTIGMDYEEIIVFGIALNVTAGLGAFAFGWIDDLFGSKRTIAFSLVAMIGLAVPVLLAQSETTFWIFALLLGIFMGPVQAASRSLMARLAPRGMETEMFGLFALSGKVTSFIGPTLVGWTIIVTGSQRIGMSTILILLVIGTMLLWRMPEPPRRED
jgi:UMF1 family MFS transporter